MKVHLLQLSVLAVVRGSICAKLISCVGWTGVVRNAAAAVVGFGCAPVAGETRL